MIPVHPSTKILFTNVESSQPTGRLPPPPYPQQSQQKLIKVKIQNRGVELYHLISESLHKQTPPPPYPQQSQQKLIKVKIKNNRG